MSSLTGLDVLWILSAVFWVIVIVYILITWTPHDYHDEEDDIDHKK